MSSNSLPYILTDKAKNSGKEMDEYDHDAFHYRFKFHKLEKAYANTDVFPYTVYDLA